MDTSTQRKATQMKTATEYAVMLLNYTGGNKLLAVKALFDAETEFKLSKDYVADVFNIITGN